MNERIKTLIKESGGHNIAYERSPGSYSYAFTDNSVEKFAELIVKECANHIRDSIQTMERGKLRASIAHAATLIEEHFGVEE